MKKYIIFINIIIIIIVIFPSLVFARVTPEDILNSKKEAYKKTVRTYSLDHKQSLKSSSDKIALVNKTRTDELERIMVNQAAILDEYETRLRQGSGGQAQNLENIKKARYWITYAHEAVAYQAAKIYVFDLSSEGKIKNDTLNTISFFQSELLSSRSKVIYSQQILKETIKQ